MPKTPPPLLGFNNNVRHRGRIFHIQTEDSGVKHARIVTHLFADGGRIVKSARTDYSEHLGRQDMSAVLRQVMKEQHKGMFVRLRAGELDDLIESACGPLPLPSDTQPAAKEPSAAAKDTREDPAPVSIEPVSGPLSPSMQDLRDGPAAMEGAGDAPALLGSTAGVGERTAIENPRRRTLSNPHLLRTAPLAAGPNVDIELDTNSLEQPDTTLEANASPSTSTSPDGASSGSGSRYGPARSPAIFGDSPPSSRSIFGERMISEKSLDEVILSYLAEDLDGPSE